jgi:hypothetical protein
LLQLSNVRHIYKQNFPFLNHFGRIEVQSFQKGRAFSKRSKKVEICADFINIRKVAKISPQSYQPISSTKRCLLATFSTVMQST